MNDEAEYRIAIQPIDYDITTKEYMYQYGPQVSSMKHVLFSSSPSRIWNFLSDTEVKMENGETFSQYYPTQAEAEYACKQHHRLTILNKRDIEYIYVPV